MRLARNAVVETSSLRQPGDALRIVMDDGSNGERAFLAEDNIAHDPAERSRLQETAVMRYATLCVGSG